MMRGTTGFEIEVMAETNRWGNPVMRELSINGVALADDVARRIWLELPASLRDALYQQAMEDAEPVGDDDASSDEARMPRSA